MPSKSILDDREGFEGLALDVAVVVAANDAEEAFLAPIAAPAVLDDPVLCARTIILTPADDGNGMVAHQIIGS